MTKGQTEIKECQQAGKRHSRQKEKHLQVPDLEAFWQVQEKPRHQCVRRRADEEGDLRPGSSELRIHVQVIY